MNFVDFTTPVPADWLNNVNFVVNQYPYGNATYKYPTNGVTRTITDKFSKELITPLDFGAVGDGVTDDTSTIQLALNTVPLGSTVVLPARTFYIAGQLTIPYGVSLVGEDGATLLGPISGTTTMVVLTGVNNGNNKPFYISHIRNIQFRVRANYSALSISNTAFLTETIEEGIVVENCNFTSFDYQTVGTAYLVSVSNVLNLKMAKCSFTSYTANGINGINNGLQVLGTANSTFMQLTLTYLNVGIGIGNSGTGAITQGVQFIGCIGNGNQIGVTTSNTNDMQFIGCLFDNHTNQAISSTNDLGLSVSDCYLGGSVSTNLVQVSITAGSSNQNVHFNNTVFICYTANTSNSLLSIQGVSGTFYNNAIINGCEFRDMNNVGAAVTANYVSGSAMTGCTLTGIPANTPVNITNSPTGSTGLRCVNNIGVNPWGPITGAGGYAAPTALTTVGTNNNYQNPYPFDCMVYIAGGTIGGVQITLGTRITNFGIIQTVLVPAGAEILVGFTGSPTWAWCGI